MSDTPTTVLSDSAEAARLRRRAVRICIVTTAVVAAIEITIGRVFGLVSVTAEGFHTAADLLDSIIAAVLVAMASRPADQQHPYGHGKYDSLAAIIEGLGVGITAAWAIAKSVLILMGVMEAHPRPESTTIAAMAIASAVYFLVSGYVLRLSERTRSPTVYAEGMHLRVHIFITIGLLVGLLATRLGMQLDWEHADRIDAMAALALGVYLLSVAWRIVVPGYRQMIDSALPAAEMQEITACLNEFRGEFVEVHAVRTRRAGTDRHVDIHLVVSADMTVQAAHSLSHRIENRLTQLYPGTRLLVHIEPAVGETLRAYIERDRVGIVLASQQSPSEREVTHHADERAHEA